MSAYRIGVDVGGTFTDFSILDETGRFALWKEESTPEDPIRAIEAGLRAVATQLGLDVKELLARTTLFVHGTTIATNTLIQRSGPTVGLLCTAGFRDVLYFRDGYKPERFNVHLRHPEPLVPRYLRLGVPERITASGDVLRPLDEAAVRAAATRFRDADVAAVAIAFLWSIVNPGHERRAAAILGEEIPGIHVLCSSDVLPEIREWERTSATVLSAYVLPMIAVYLRRLERLLVDDGFARPPLVMQINGGCGTVGEILRAPVVALASGPAAAPAAAAFHASRLGLRDLITLDMGGTSLDVCVIHGGRPAISRTIRVEDQPVGVPGVEVHSVGAGGGSIAWIDPGGALRVGPESAGARPGPACYGQGGSRPTVTDANVVVGYLAPEAFLGGRRTLQRELAEEAIAREIAEPLGLDLMAAAAGILRVVDSNMVAAIRAVSLERGMDPRRYVLIVGGGAGGLHAARLARALGISQILVPREASTFCAFGMTVTDVRRDYARARYSLSSDADAGGIENVLIDLEAAARTHLRDDGFADEHITLERHVDARYSGQVHEITVDVPPALGSGNGSLTPVERRFHEEHERLFTYMRADVPVEFLHWRVTGRGRLPFDPERLSEPHEAASVGSAEVGVREVYLPDDGLVTAAVYTAERMTPGSRADGPAIIQAETTTILLLPGDEAEVNDEGTFVLTVGVAAKEPASR